ncbi:MAG: ATP-binding protein [Bacteroidetes bacterium]|nr:ATP-binding protein [Bacteroidota bacterium]
MIVFLSGSESTGKTELARSLSEIYKVPWIPEFAREYMEKLDHDYSQEDVEAIAKIQLIQIKKYQEEALVFFDTGLVITKVWFQELYKSVPEWFSEVYEIMAKGHYLLCYPDLDWISDPVRENADKRLSLHAKYESEITKLAAPYATIKGQGDSRLQMAVKILEIWGFNTNNSDNGTRK